MPHRNSSKKIQLPNIVLRRSPRFFQIKPPDPEHQKTCFNDVLRRSPRFVQPQPLDTEYPKTPFLQKQGRIRLQSSETLLTSTTRKMVSSRKRISKKEVSVALKESNSSRKCSENPPNGLTTPSPLSDICEEKSSRSCNWGSLESRRPMTRSWCRDADRVSKKIDYSGSTGKTYMPTIEECVSVSKCLRGKSLKKKLKDSKKSGNDKCNEADEDALEDKMNKGDFLIKKHHFLDDELPEKHIDKLGKKTDCWIDEVPKTVGTKRKRNQAKNNIKISEGWTKDQELALERAYLTANPTPHFWKKVSKLVPGKSAQQCFDKIHCSHVTPPQPRSRSKAVMVSQNTNLSPSKLLDSSSQKVKRLRSHKQKSHIIQRTVRHMLQKQYKVEKESEMDLFSVLEPTLSPSYRLFTTPDCNKFNGKVADKYQEGSSTAALRKNRSRFSSIYETPIISPPVLKPVKNIVLHEKYIDRLNCREANRKAVSLNKERKGTKLESSVRRKDEIKAAKLALVFNAKDAINRFQDRQVKALSSIFDDESGSDNETEGEDFS